MEERRRKMIEEAVPIYRQWANNHRDYRSTAELMADFTLAQLDAANAPKAGEEEG